MTDGPTPPAMRQYYSVKARYPPDAVIFFRMGDFFETFGEDAGVVARELDITLTARGGKDKNGDRMPLAGVPPSRRRRLHRPPGSEGLQGGDLRPGGGSEDREGRGEAGGHESDHPPRDADRLIDARLSRRTLPDGGRPPRPERCLRPRVPGRLYRRVLRLLGGERRARLRRDRLGGREAPPPQRQ